MKHIRALAHKPYRDTTKLYFVEGVRLVLSALENHADCEEIVYVPELLQPHILQKVYTLVARSEVSLTEVTSSVFKTVSHKDGPQGIGAVLRQAYLPLDSLQCENRTYIALDRIQDPGNIGTILRTGDAAGAAGVLLLGNCADPYDPTSTRASMGAIFSQQIYKGTQEELFSVAMNCGALCIGASDSGHEDYRTVEYKSPLILCMGSEREGLTAQLLARCDHLAYIPMVGKSDSLNVAIATGILLYEIFRQQHVVGSST